MSKPIYNLFINRGMTDRWWRLSAAERGAMREKLFERHAAAGGQYYVACIASWWNQNYTFWGVEVFPNFDAWRKFAAAREEMEWYTYSRGWSVLGTWDPSLDPAQAVIPQPGKIYQAFLYSGTEAYYQLTQAERDALQAKEAETRRDAQVVVYADSYWASEEWQGFGVLMFPDIEGVQRHYAGLRQIEWPRYVRGKTLLGTLLSPDIEGFQYHAAELQMIGRPRWMRDQMPISTLWEPD